MTARASVEDRLAAIELVRGRILRDEAALAAVMLGIQDTKEAARIMGCLVELNASLLLSIYQEDALHVLDRFEANLRRQQVEP